jgi:hypothetical protein
LKLVGWTRVGSVYNQRDGKGVRLGRAVEELLSGAMEIRVKFGGEKMEEG